MVKCATPLAPPPLWYPSNLHHHIRQKCEVVMIGKLFRESELNFEVEVSLFYSKGTFYAEETAR